jgi:uncharacterized membrane protein YukC
MQLNIEKKFTMLSTKEWMQYLQHKLPNDREKELLDRAEYDEFLRESLEAINSMEGRHLAYQSLNYIHQQIENTTGVSESRISNTNIDKYETPVDTKKYLMIGLAVLAVILIAYGVFYFFNNTTHSNEENDENSMNELVEDTSSASNTIDSSSLPMEQITPDASSAANVPAATTSSATTISDNSKSNTPASTTQTNSVPVKNTNDN